jgi:uncharacterized membrane protein YdjX (TVP38/TMEM64 family)
MLGHGGRAVLNNSLNGSKTYHSIYARIEKWMESRGALTIFLGSAVVNPFFLPMGAAAATVRFPAWKFFLLCWAGKTAKGIIIALLGSLGLKVIFRAFGIPL